MPRSGTLTNLTAYFSVATALNLTGENITVHARLYQSTTPNNTFSAVPGATINLLPTLNAAVPVGFISTGSVTGINVGVTQGTRLLLVFYATQTGTAVARSINGYASAGLAIS